MRDVGYEVHSVGGAQHSVGRLRKHQPLSSIRPHPTTLPGSLRRDNGEGPKRPLDMVGGTLPAFGAEWNSYSHGVPELRSYFRNIDEMARITFHC